MTQINIPLLQTAEKIFIPLHSLVKRKAQGRLYFDYLVPSGAYEEQWDWDGFFISIALASRIPSEAIYLRNWVLNFILNSQHDGYTPGCITPRGRDKRLHHMKPFLAQGAYFASLFLRDLSWLKDYFSRLVTIVLYRERNLWNKQYDLGVWFNSMESGADNNIAALHYPDKSVIGSDLNSYIYREYKALMLIAQHLKRTKDAKFFQKRTEIIRKNINTHLWSEKDKAYFNIDSSTGRFIKRVSFNSLHPLWAGISSPEQANQFITKYLLNRKKLWSSYGIRTLAKDDKDYNNANIIKPYSNWQGPIWPIANYIALHALLSYGRQKEAITLANRITTLCLKDIENTGAMHENYHAETGKPLAAPEFLGWNLLVGNMLLEALQKKNPLLL